LERPQGQAVFGEKNTVCPERHGRMNRVPTSIAGSVTGEGSLWRERSRNFLGKKGRVSSVQGQGSGLVEGRDIWRRLILAGAKGGGWVPRFKAVSCSRIGPEGAPLHRYWHDERAHSRSGKNWAALRARACGWRKAVHHRLSSATSPSERKVEAARPPRGDQ